MDVPEAPKTPEKAPPADPTNLTKSASRSFRSNRKLPQIRSTADMIEKCLSELDGLMDEHLSPKTLEAANQLLNTPSGLAMIKVKSDLTLSGRRNSSELLRKYTKTCDERIADGKRELSELMTRSGGIRKRTRHVERVADSPRVRLFEGLGDEGNGSEQRALPSPLPSPSKGTAQGTAQGLGQSPGHEDATDRSLSSSASHASPSSPARALDLTAGLTPPEGTADTSQWGDAYHSPHSPLHAPLSPIAFEADSSPDRSSIYRQYIQRIEDSLDDSQAMGMEATVSHAIRVSHVLDYEDDDSSSSEDGEKVMHDGDMSFDHQKNAYYTSPGSVDHSISHSHDVSHITEHSLTNGHDQEVSREVVLGDVYPEPPDSEEAAFLLKYKLLLKKEFLKTEVNSIAHWLETEYLERNGRFKVLLDEQQKTLAEKVAVEEELSSAQEELLFVRSQLQNKSAKVLDLESEVMCSHHLVTALSAEVRLLREQCLMCEEQVGMSREDLAMVIYLLQTAPSAGDGDDTAAVLLEAKQEETDELLEAYELLAQDYSNATNALNEVIAKRDEVVQELQNMTNERNALQRMVVELQEQLTAAQAKVSAPSHAAENIV